MFSEESDSDFFILLLVALLLTSLFIGVIITLIVHLRRLHQKNQHEKGEIRQSYQHELLKVKLEIQEQTFTHISEEIHDNIGQSLSLVKLNLNMGGKKQLEQAKQILSDSIQDLRNLTHNLHTENLRNKGLVAAMRDELQRLQQSGLCEVRTDLVSEAEMDSEKGILVFRIFQEALNNCIKHAEAKKIEVKLAVFGEKISMEITDDGIGFDAGKKHKGLGLANMRRRADFSAGELTIRSKPGKGCHVKLTVDLRKPVSDANHAGSHSRRS
ncbi:MAG: sensor histidine kinase [Mucilaginibacter polytrichastri]|nr:sensor histidine kinase [Mucilaginibacter polytrichastri]